MIVKIPHDNINSGFQEFNLETCKRTKFQINRVKQISELSEFKQFVLTNTDIGLIIVHPDYKSKFTCLYYDKSDKLICEVIGLNRVLRKHEG